MNPQEVTKEFKEELKKYLEANDNENTYMGPPELFLSQQLKLKILKLC